jgi:hypothetical protein
VSLYAGLPLIEIENDLKSINVYITVKLLNPFTLYNKKVKQSRYRPGVAQRVPGSSSFQIT